MTIALIVLAAAAGYVIGWRRGRAAADTPHRRAGE